MDEPAQFAVEWALAEVWNPATIVAVPLKDIADWLEPFRRFWEEKFVSLDGYLKETQKREKKNDRKKR